MEEIVLEKIPNAIKEICEWCYPITSKLRECGYYWRVDNVRDCAYLYDDSHKMHIWIVKHNITFCLPNYVVPIDCPEQATLLRRMKYTEQLINKYGLEDIYSRVDDRKQEKLHGVMVTVIRSKNLYECFNEKLNDDF